MIDSPTSLDLFRTCARVARGHTPLHRLNGRPQRRISLCPSHRKKPHKATPITMLQTISFFSTGSSGSYSICLSSSAILGSVIGLLLEEGKSQAKGGRMPWKKIHEIASATQITNPKRQTTYTTANRPMPSSHSLRKLETTPMVKKVMTKKMLRNTLACAMAVFVLPSKGGDRTPIPRARRKVRR